MATQRNGNVLSKPQLEQIHGWWRAANYLSVGQIFLMDNPLLEQPLKKEHIKPRRLGHWGTTPGLNLIYAHMNKVIKNENLNAIFITGPGHGAPALLANTWMEGSYNELYPDISQDRAGMQKLFRQFSFPGGVPSHCSPETPAPSMKVVNWGIRWPMPLALFLTIRIYWPCVLWVMARPKPTHWQRYGKAINLSIRHVMVPFYRSCTSMVTRLPSRDRYLALGWKRKSGGKT